LYINLKRHFDREIPRSRFEEIIKSRYITEVNPVRDFIEKNKHRRPSGTFDKWLECMTLRNRSIDRSIVLHYLKKWYVGLVSQTMDPEYPNEFFLCLLSTEQGIGKTTFLRKYTVPKELQKYCAEHSLNYDDDFKVIMGQTILIIDDEMDGRTYETEKTFKNLMSQDVLPTRRKYDRRISKIKRRCSFAGSGNNLNVIREHQNRRIIPIEIEKFDFTKMDQLDLDDLYMEAYHLYMNGFRYSYQQDDKQRMRELYDDYIQKSDTDMVLDAQVQVPESSADVYQVSLLDLVTCLLNQYPYYAKRLNVVTVGKILNDRGFRSLRKGRNKTTYYEISRKSEIINLISANTDGVTFLG
jgi:predicted P-loop ATPase